MTPWKSLQGPSVQRHCICCTQHYFHERKQSLYVLLLLVGTCVLTRNKAEGASFLDQRLPFLPLEAGWSLSQLKEGGEGKAACLTLLLYLLLHPESVFC